MGVGRRGLRTRRPAWQIGYYSILPDMPEPPRYARIAITLPEKDLAAADRLARRHDRSRSWIVAEGIRRYAAADEATREPVGGAGRAPAAAAKEPPGERGLGASRRAQLIRDLTLTPEERVREAEETVRLTEPQSKIRTHQLAVFDRYDDFLDWKRSRALQR